MEFKLKMKLTINMLDISNVRGTISNMFEVGADAAATRSPNVSEPGDASAFQGRMEAIFQILTKRGSIRVVELRQMLGVSDMTIRRCLNAMAADGLIQRYHGGAKAIQGAETRFRIVRNALNANVKALLAGKAIEFVPDNGSIYVDSGTTCFAMVKRLAASGKKLNLVTDSFNVVRELQKARNITATLLGGNLCDDMTTLEGPIAVEAASRVTLDACFFSADAFNEDRLDIKYLAGATTRKILLSRSERKICLCDSSKYNRRCCFMFCDWDGVDMLLTDALLPEGAKKAIAKKGVRVVTVTEAMAVA